MRRRFRGFPTCDITLGSLTLLAPEAGDFVELLLPHVLQRPVGNIITLASSTVWTLSTVLCSQQKAEHISRRTGPSAEPKKRARRTQLGPLRKTILNPWGLPIGPNSKDLSTSLLPWGVGADPVPKMLHFLF